MASPNYHYNVAVIGMTGVGKSTLLNYLYGEKVAKTGMGEPVTSEGFHKYDFKINDLPVNLFDSCGLEVNKAKEWRDWLNKELSDRGLDYPAEKWFHTILYCISGGGGRVQPVDVEIIKQLKEKKYPVIVIMTKADQLSEEEEAQFIKEIKQCTNNAVSVIPVCSESKSMRGVTINAFGKENIEDEIYNNFWKTIIARLPQRCRYIVEKELDIWKCTQIDQIKKRADAGDSIEAIQKSLNNFWDNRAIPRLIENELSRTFNIYGQISENFDSKYNYNKSFKLDDASLGKKYSTTFSNIGVAIMQSGVLSNVGSAVVANISAPLAGILGIGGGGLMGPAIGIATVYSALIPVVNVLTVAVPILTVAIMRHEHRRKAVESLINTVHTETDKYKLELNKLEKAIELSLINLQNLP